MFKPTKKEIGQYKTTLVRCSREAALGVSCLTGAMIGLAIFSPTKDVPWIARMGAGAAVGGFGYLSGAFSREKLWFTSEDEKQLSASANTANTPSQPQTSAPVAPVQPQVSYTPTYDPEPEPYPIPTYKPERADRVVEKLKRVKKPVENTFDLNDWESDLGLDIEVEAELQAKPKSKIDRPRKEARPRPRPTLEDLGLTEKDLAVETSTLPVKQKPVVSRQSSVASNEPSLWDAL